MIQRIQTLYLLLTTLIPLLFLKLKLLSFTGTDGSEYYLGFKGLFTMSEGQVLNLVKQLHLISILIAIIPVLSLVTVFLFRNRRLQLKMILLIILLSMGFIIAEIIYSIMITKEYGVTIIPGFAMVIPVLILIFSGLAYRGIKKDENLVRSYDRLR